MEAGSHCYTAGLLQHSTLRHPCFAVWYTVCMPCDSRGSSFLTLLNLPSPWRGSNWGKSCWNSMLLYSVPFVDGRLFVTSPSTVHPINMTPKMTLVLLPLKARWAKKLGLCRLLVMRWTLWSRGSWDRGAFSALNDMECQGLGAWNIVLWPKLVP